MLNVAQRERLRADPLLAAGDERARTLPEDVEVLDLAVHADGIEGVLLAVDEFLDVDLVDLPHPANGFAEIRGVVDAIRVLGAGTGDRLEDRRVAHLLDGGPALLRGARAGV